MLREKVNSLFYNRCLLELFETKSRDYAKRSEFANHKCEKFARDQYINLNSCMRLPEAQGAITNISMASPSWLIW